MNTIDYSAWKARYHDAVGALEGRAGELWRGYARDPAKLVRLQHLLIAICLLWSLISVSRLVWIPLRTDAIDAVPAAVANPPRLAGESRSVVIAGMRSLLQDLASAQAELYLHLELSEPHACQRWVGLLHCPERRMGNVKGGCSACQMTA